MLMGYEDEYGWVVEVIMVMNMVMNMVVNMDKRKKVWW